MVPGTTKALWTSLRTLVPGASVGMPTLICCLPRAGCLTPSVMT
jgi:hypothetical protein